MTINLTPTVRLEIDQVALSDNFNRLKKASKLARCGAAVKANAYGCGIKNVVPVLLKNGCNDFFVADALEGQQVRKLAPSGNIYVLNGFICGTEKIIAQNKLIPIIASEQQLVDWRQMGSRAPYSLQIETGMNRLGIRHDRVLPILAELDDMPTLILSHFANADDPDDKKNREQLEAFKTIVAQYPDISASMSNSAATISNPDAHFQLTRPGIAIYGGNPINNVPNPMKPVFKLDTQIIDIRTVKKGETVSYGGTFTALHDIKIATCGIGYADGLPRSSSGNGVAFRAVRPNGLRGYMKGKYLTGLGRITMDLSMFDCTHIPENEIKAGDWMEILGDHITADDMAEQAGMVSYEVLTSLGRHRNSVV